MTKGNSENINNRDPISNKAGSHPVGAGIGTAAGAAIGAAAGSVVGPIGTVGGGLIGGIAGWLEGRVIAESVNPTAEETYWRQNFSHSPHFDRKYKWEDYRPAYTVGYSSYAAGRKFSDVEPELEESWEDIRGESRMTWDEARPASEAAWNRLSKDSDSTDS